MSMTDKATIDSQLKNKIILVWNEIIVAAQTTNGEDNKLPQAYEKFKSLLLEVVREVHEDYKEAQDDHNRLVRELDVLMNGDGAAKQASLCDIVAQFPKWKLEQLEKVRGL